MNDIGEWIKENKQVRYGGDKWVVTTSMIYTPEQRRLNKELGIHAVNKGVS